MTKNSIEFKCDVLELKDSADTGTFTGLCAHYGSVDQGDDRIEPGAFTKTLAESGGRLPLLADHEIPIGVANVSDSSKGLLVRGVLNLDKAAGRDAYSDMKFYKQNGVQVGMSFAYRTIKSFMDKGVRVLTELQLKEATITLWPMNKNAMVEAVKSDSEYAGIVARIAELRAIIRKYS